MGLYEIEVFKDTRVKSLTDFYKATTRLIHNTRVFKYPCDIKEGQDKRYNNMKVTFTNEGTVNTGVRYSYVYDRVAVLNFADALTVGGLVWEGETTQEEGICRCTNLYESILSATSYYKHNLDSNSKGLYTNALIYSPDVLAFKDENMYRDIEPVYFDVISCPSPSIRFKNKVDARKVFINRIEGILKAAAANGVNCLVLGAWGCGAFGQDAVLMGECFARMIKKYNYFYEVVFAIKCVNPSMDEGNYNKFLNGFKSVYKGNINEELIDC